MSLPYFPMFPTDFEAKTSHLSLAEDGAYNRLLRLCWMTPGCSVPADRAWVYRRMRAHTEADQAVIEAVIAEFFKEAGGRLSNARLAKEWLAANDAHQRRKKAGSKGGKAKAQKTKENGASNATAKPKQPEPEPEVIVELSSRAADFRARCFEAAGLDPKAAMAVPGLVSTVSLETLIRDQSYPCDPELDVLPAIESCAATLRKRGQTLTNWSYCREAALRNRDQRLAGNPAPTAQPARQVPAAPPRQKHSGGGVAAAAMRVAAQLRESRGQHDDPVGHAEPDAGHELDGVFEDHRRIAGAGG